MTRHSISKTLRLSGLAVAVAAIVAPVAWSSGQAPIVNKVPNFDNVQSAVTAAAEDEPVDRFIITYRDGAGSASVRQASTSQVVALEAIDDVIISPLRTLSTGADLIGTSRPLNLTESKLLMSELLKDPNILAVDPDIRVSALFVPNDPLYAQQWHYKNGAGGINAEPAWDITRGAGSVVAVLDTGIVAHSDLVGQTVPGYDFIADIPTANDGNGRDADPSDPGDWDSFSNSSWHGTHVSGTIAALTNNGIGVSGVAHEAKVMPVRVLGRGGGFTSDILDAITWASGGTVTGVPANPNPAEVINMSLGGGGACSTAWQNAINAAVARGTTVVVAAGNSGGDAANLTPASCNNVIAVAAVGPTGAKAGYSSFGAVVDVAAPGGSGTSPAENNVLSTLNLGLTAPAGEAYAWYAGTSMAAPHVAGIVALMQSVATTPKTPAEIKTILENTAYANGGFPGGCSFATPCGTGIVDARAAVDVARGATPLPPNPPGPPPPPPRAELTNGVTLTGLTVARNQELQYELVVPNGASNLLFAMFGGTGDADIYVRYGQPPTLSSFNCRPFSGGNNETCFFPAPQSGKWYVNIRGFSTTPAAGFSLYTSFVDQNYPYKEAATVVQGDNHHTAITLTWQHGKREVDLYRNGELLNTVRNKLTYTDRFRIVGSGTMRYKICNIGTTECSNEVAATYNSRP